MITKLRPHETPRLNPKSKIKAVLNFASIKLTQVLSGVV